MVLAAQVAQEQTPARLEQVQRLADDRDEEIRVGEVLRDRVDHDRVEAFVAVCLDKGGDLVGLAAGDPDIDEADVGQFAGDLIDRALGEIDAEVPFYMGRHPEQQQARAAADLQHTLWLLGADAGYGLLDPVEHLGSVDRLARVAVVPAGDVERLVERFVNEVAAGAIRLVPDLSPRFGSRVQVGAAGDDVGHQTGVTRRVGASHHDVLERVGVAADRGFDLAEFDAVAADLDLMVDPAAELDLTVGQHPRQVAGAVDA